MINYLFGILSMLPIVGVLLIAIKYYRDLLKIEEDYADKLCQIIKSDITKEE